ncbi:hypothetical protein [Streptomyces sp. IBSBF 2950]|uniref:hypothetical protein n=1 Tax=Streptomyces sp. IBSBF 2950 TaxID=2903528 RepID=UPI002FDBDE50
MGIKLMVETLDHWRDAGLTVGERDDLLVLAENANEDTRLTWGPVHAPYILRRANKSAASWKNSIGKLIKKGVLAHQSGGHRGRIAVYRLASLCPQGSHDGWQGMCRRPEKGHPTDDPKSPGLGHSTDDPTGQLGHPVDDPTSGALGHPTDDPTDELGHSTGDATDELGHLTGDPYPSSTTPSSTTPSVPASAKPDAAASDEGALFDEPTPAAPAAKTPSRKKTAEPKPNRHQVADDLTKAFWELHGKRAQSFVSILGVVRTAISNGLDRNELAHAMDHCARNGRSISGASLDIALGEIRRGGQRPTAPPTAPRHMTEEEKRDALQF